MGIRRLRDTRWGFESQALVIVLSLAFVTGVVDAASYLGLDEVLSANMAGNVVLLTMGLAAGDDLSVLHFALALAGFGFGAALSARVRRKDPPPTPLSIRGVLVLGGASVPLLGTGHLTGLSEDSNLRATALSGVLGLPMASQTTFAKRLAVNDVSTVVLTMTPTSLAADSRLEGGEGNGWARRVGAVLAMAAGAFAGALTPHLSDTVTR